MIRRVANWAGMVMLCGCLVALVAPLALWSWLFLEGEATLGKSEQKGPNV